MHHYTLNEVENATLEKWVNSRPIKRALKNGAKLSLTFSETGIGTHIIAELDKGHDCLPIIPPKDITDYKSW